MVEKIVRKRIRSRRLMLPSVASKQSEHRRSLAHVGLAQVWRKKEERILQGIFDEEFAGVHFVASKREREMNGIDHYLLFQRKKQAPVTVPVQFIFMEGDIFRKTPELWEGRLIVYVYPDVSVSETIAGMRKSMGMII